MFVAVELLDYASVHGPSIDINHGKTTYILYMYIYIEAYIHLECGSDFTCNPLQEACAKNMPEKWTVANIQQ